MAWSRSSAGVRIESDLLVLRLGDLPAAVRHLLGVGAVVVDVLAVAADRLDVLLLLHVRVGDPELGQLGVAGVGVLALHLAEERLGLDPVVVPELDHRLVVRALRVGGVAERGPRLTAAPRRDAERARRDDGRGREARRGRRGHRRRSYYCPAPAHDLSRRGEAVAGRLLEGGPQRAGPSGDEASSGRRDARRHRRAGLGLVGRLASAIVADSSKRPSVVSTSPT